MATTLTKYTHAHKILCGEGDWTGDTIKLALVTSGYTFSAAHTVWADASGSEVADGNGYATGGATVSASKTNAALGAGNTTFTALNKTFRAGVIYISGTVESLTDPVLFYLLFDDTPADITISGIDFVVAWNASGVATLS
jgi:hypothetical protein